MIKTYENRFDRIRSKNIIANTFFIIGTLFLISALTYNKPTDTKGLFILLMTSLLGFVVSSIIKPKNNCFKSIYKRLQK